MTHDAGFSIVEIVIVVLVGALLVAIGLPVAEGYIDRTRVAQAVVDVGDMSKSLRQIDRSTGALPATLAEVGLDGKIDPWGRPYAYLNLRLGGGQPRKDKALRPLNSDFDLYSIGKDGDTRASLLHPKSRDDVIRARDGAFIGTASEFDP